MQTQELRHSKRTKPLIQQNSSENPSVYFLWNASMKRYSILSAVQLIATILCDGMSVVGNLMRNWKINISDDGYNIFIYNASLFATFDLMMLILCIYIGFVRRKTVRIPIQQPLQYHL